MQIPDTGIDTVAGLLAGLLAMDADPNRGG
jgi:hypothetical protein